MTKDNSLSHELQDAQERAKYRFRDLRARLYKLLAPAFESPLLLVSSDEEGDVIVRDLKRPGCLTHAATEAKALANIEQVRAAWDAAFTQTVEGSPAKGAPLCPRCSTPLSDLYGIGWACTAFDCPVSDDANLYDPATGELKPGILPPFEPAQLTQDVVDALIGQRVELTGELEKAKQELRDIDALLARRPALEGLSRYDGVSKAIRTASQVDTLQGLHTRLLEDYALAVEKWDTKHAALFAAQATIEDLRKELEAHDTALERTTPWRRRLSWLTTRLYMSPRTLWYRLLSSVAFIPVGVILNDHPLTQVLTAILFWIVSGYLWEYPTRHPESPDEDAE